ncbi:hypothetical protein DFH27DRAFT_278018 [Peziza echinospora]|nr:hypothetical protein DFH27DRAFT_278018 [Peziza echinospora]
MGTASGDRIIFVTVAWLLMAILYAFVGLRWWMIRRESAHKWNSLRSIGGILVYLVAFLTTAYTATVTWFALWSDPINAVETGGVARILLMKIPMPVVSEMNVMIVMKTQIALNALYVTIVWMAKAAFLLLCFEAWGKISKSAQIAWGVAAASTATSWLGVFIVLIVKGISCLKKGESISEVDHFAGGHDFFTKKLVLLVGLANILTTLMIITAGLLVVRSLRRRFNHQEFRTTISVFGIALAAMLIEACRMATSHYPHGRRSWSDTLAMCQVFLWAAAVCLPAIAFARSNISPRRSRPSEKSDEYDERSDSASRSPASRNRKNLSVKTDPSIRPDLGYTIAQGDNGEKVKSAPLFALPEKAAVGHGGLRSARAPRTPRTARTPLTGRRWDEKVKHKTGVEGSSGEDSSSEEEGLGSALRSGVEEGRDWRRNMYDLPKPASAKTAKHPK